MKKSVMNWLMFWRSAQPLARKQVRFLPNSAEDLEFRVMLDGNVTAIVADGDLNLSGDAAANDVEVTILDGDVVVQGLNGTTINGSADSFVAFNAATRITGNVSVNLAGGNDLVALSNGVEVGGNLAVIDFQGASEVGIHNSTISGNLLVLTGNAADSVVISRATISGVAQIATHGGADVVTMLETTVGGATLIRTGSQSDAVVIEESELNGNLFLNTGRHQDDVAIIDSTVNGSLFGRTGSGNDLVMFDGATVTGRTQLLLLQGNDTVVAQNTNTFTGRAFIGGILGNSDSFQASAETSFGSSVRAAKFENDTVDADTLDSRLNDDPDGLLTRSTAAQTVFGDIIVGDFDLTAALAADANVVDSSGTPLTKDNTLSVEGVTLANATVNVDADGDGAFDDGTAIADEDGNYTVDVTLGDGAQSIMYEVTDSIGRETVMTATTDVYKAIGTVLKHVTTLGEFDVELLDTDAPLTVANYLSFLDDYQNSIVHRSLPNTFIVQGGEYNIEGDDLVEIVAGDTVLNEFNAANSNLAGTLSTALPDGQPDGFTTSWFFNTKDNVDLDAAQHTVFGRIIGDGLDVITAIDDLPIFNIDETDPALATVPLQNYSEDVDLTGTFSVTAGELTVTGTDTAFTTELEIGQTIDLGDQTVTIADIASDTELTLTEIHVNGATDATVTVENTPVADNFIVFTSITEILV